jgi:glycosyltransferase involved in cell wall biosynthesis
VTGSDEPTRVCLVAQGWAPKFSGAALRFQQYLPGLRERGIEVDVVCSTAPGEDSPQSVSRWAKLDFGEMLPVEEIDGTAVRRVKLPAGRSLRRNMLFRGAVRRHLGSARVHVAQFLTLGPLRTYPGSGLRRAGAKGVFTGTQLWSFSENPVKRALQRQWIRVPIQKLDHIIVSSAVMRDFYESLGITIPMSIIPNGVDLQRFRSLDPAGDKKSARDTLGISATTDVVVFVGSIIHRKGVDLLLDAFARVAATNPTAELILVGPRDDSTAEEARTFDAQVDDLVQTSGAADRIHFAGYVPNVDTYLRAADVFVLPSRREGMGNAALEAMATGIPTVLTPYLGLPGEFGKPGRQYMLSTPDADSLAWHIGSLLADRDRREAVGEAGRRWVTEHMNISLSIDEYSGMYHNLARYQTPRGHDRRTG